MRFIGFVMRFQAASVDQILAAMRIMDSMETPFQN